MKKAFAILMAIVFATMTVVPAMAAKVDPLDGAIREASTYLNNNIPKGSKVAFVNIAGGYPDLAEYVLGDLERNGVNDKSFTVVDRAQLDAVRAELNFNSSGEVSDSSAQAIGQVLGAQTIVTGGVRKIGNNFRLDVKAIEVQTAKVQGSWSSKNIPNKDTIADLTKRTGSTSTATANATAAASGGKSGGASTGSTAAAAPAKPAGLKNGTYSFWPRPKATEAGIPKPFYLDRVVVGGGYLTVFVTGAERGKGSTGAIRDWANCAADDCMLENLDNPRLVWKGVSIGWGEADDDKWITFQGVTGTRFSISSPTWGTNPPHVIEFTMPDEPDSN